MALPARDPKNRYWPLPVNYPNLSASDQRLARLRLLTSWWNPDQPKYLITDTEAFYYAFRFFKEYYLKGWEGNKHIYTDATPGFHKDWVRWVAEHPLMVLTAFRGSAKTLMFGFELPSFLCACRAFTPVQYTSANDSMTIKQVREVRMQLENNSRIVEDFGQLRPSRESGLKWTEDYVEFTNGSSLKGLSFRQKIRGTTQRSQRALCQIFDDPEDDREIKNPELIRQFEDRFWDVLMPAASPEAWRIWTNTRLDAHAFAVKAKSDSKFSNWHFVQQDLAYYAPNMDPETAEEHPTVLRSYWPERFPDAMVRAMAGEMGELKGVVAYGKATFLTEFMNDPRRKGRTAFDYDPDRHTARWVVEEGKRFVILADGQKRSWDDIAASSNSLVSIDVSLGQTSHSDLSAITVGFCDHENCLWIVDYWSDRARPKEVADRALKKCEQWVVTGWALQKTLLEMTLLDFVRDELDDRKLNGRYCPELVLTRGFGGDAKNSHIMSLAWRFKQDKIRLVRPDPSDVEATAAFLELEDQITFFTERGAFKFDDLLDALTILQDGFLAIGTGVLQPKHSTTLADKMRQAKKDGVNPYVGLHNIDPATLLQARLKRSTGGLHPNLDEDVPLMSLAGAFEGDMAGSVFSGSENW